jgi:hypothetical protein
VLRGNALGVAYLARSERRFEGSYDVRVEARILGEPTADSRIAVVGDLQEDVVRYEVGAAAAGPFFRQGGAGGETLVQWSGVAEDVSPPLDPEAWHVYELAFGPTEVTARVDGQVVARTPRTTEGRRGHVGLVVQKCVLAVRRVEVVLH